MSASMSLVPSARVEGVIIFLRGEKVILDADLARLYEVETRALLQAVKRNSARFPADFMFRLSHKECASLRKLGRRQPAWGGSRYRPFAFTEHGVAMLSAVLRSSRAIHVSLVIVRTFVRLREILSSHEHLARRIGDLERSTQAQFQAVFTVLNELSDPVEKKKEPIGFRVTRRTPDSSRSDSARRRSRRAG